jgi:NADH-quinone oxidoreductase chain G
LLWTVDGGRWTAQQINRRTRWDSFFSMVTLTIDGKQVTVEEGTTILKAAEKLGVEIPTFCNHDKLEPVGACRMCLVEVEKNWKLQVACGTPVSEGMVVKTDTPQVRAARRGVLEFLLINHPLDCPVCDKGGECELQNLVFKHGSDKSRYAEEKRLFVVDPKSKYDDLALGTHIVRNQNRCILCRKCVRFISEIAGETDLGTFGRAAKSEINVLPDIPLDNPYSGNTVEMCPVGALTSKSFRYKIRVWQTEVTPSVCSLCADGCNLKLWTKENKIYRVTSRRNDSVDEGFLCDRGRFGCEFVNHPDRLTQPLVRKDGQLQPVDWDEAIELAASRLQAAKSQFASNSLAGVGSPRLTNEENYLFQKFFRVVLGTNNLDHRVDSEHLLPGLSSAGRSYGMTNSVADIEQAKLVLVLGCDLEKEHPILNLRAIKSVRRGNRLILVNPESTRLNRFAAEELLYPDGTEAVLLNALLRELGEKEQGSDLSDSAQKTGIPSEKIKELAESLKQTESLLVLCGNRVATHRDNAHILNRLETLLRVTGHEGKENSGVNLLWPHCNSQGALDCGVLPERLPGYLPAADGAARNRVEQVWQAKIPGSPGLDFNQMLEAINRGEIRGMYVLGSDPVGSHPKSDYVGKTFSRLAFLVVQDLFLTDTAKLAHVVLPGVSFAEKEGTFTNVERRIQKLTPAFGPLGGSKPEWYVICMLAQVLGHDFHYDSPAQIFQELTSVSPIHAGITLSDVGDTGERLKRI